MLDIFAEIRDDLRIVEEELRTVVQVSDSFITETATHLINAGGKRLRPALSLLSAKFYHYNLQMVLPLAVALELIHMATLVHDDVVDSAVTRRGIPTVKSMWGNKISIHLGDYIFAKSLILIAGYENPVISRVLSDTSVKMTEGEIQQISTILDTSQNIKDYFYRINRKTALLIAASCQLGAAACGAPASVYGPLRRYGHSIGMAFQITDDVLDLVADQQQLGKPIGSDLHQGIITLPVIYALDCCSSKKRLWDIVFKEEKTEGEVREAVSLIVSCGGVDYANEVALKYIQKAKEQLQLLPDIPARDTLSTIADFVSVRKF
jgi:heptaprenyl diphosphate synthase